MTNKPHFALNASEYAKDGDFVRNIIDQVDSTLEEIEGQLERAKLSPDDANRAMIPDIENALDHLHKRVADVGAEAREIRNQLHHPTLCLVPVSLVTHIIDLNFQQFDTQRLADLIEEELRKYSPDGERYVSLEPTALSYEEAIRTGIAAIK